MLLLTNPEQRIGCGELVSFLLSAELSWELSGTVAGTLQQRHERRRDSYKWTVKEESMARKGPFALRNRLAGVPKQAGCKETGTAKQCENNAQTEENTNTLTIPDEFSAAGVCGLSVSVS